MGLKETTSNLTQQLMSKGVQFINEGVEMVSDGIEALLPQSAESIATERREREQAALEARQAAEETARVEALASISDYLSKQRRSLLEITSDIETERAEQTRLSDELATIENELFSGDLEPNTKTLQRRSTIQSLLIVVAGRLARLQAELREATQATIVADYAADVDATLAMVAELQEFEGGEWQAVKRAYDDGISRINRTRAQLRLKQVTKRDDLEQKYGRDAVVAVADKLTALENHPELSITWK